MEGMRIVLILALAPLALGQGPKIDRKRIDKAFADGIQYSQSGEPAKAIASFSEVISMSGGTADAKVYFQRGQAFLSRGDLDQALEDFDKCTSLGYEHSQLYLSRGEAWNRKQEFQKAESDYGKAIKLRLDDPQAWKARGLLRANLRRFRDAIDDFDLPIVYSAETILTVDWNLEKGLDEAAILLPSKLKMLIEEKGFSGKQLREVLSAEETKLIEPLIGNQVYYAQQNRLKDNRLFYVAEVTDEQERAAFVESVKKATEQANMLAQSAGMRVGKLKSIQRIPVVDPIPFQANAWMLEQIGANVTLSRVKNDREVTNIDSNGLKRTLTVHMVFEVE